MAAPEQGGWRCASSAAGEEKSEIHPKVYRRAENAPSISKQARGIKYPPWSSYRTERVSKRVHKRAATAAGSVQGYAAARLKQCEIRLIELREFVSLGCGSAVVVVSVRG